MTTIPLATWQHLLSTIQRQRTEGRVPETTARVWLHRWLTEVRYGIEPAERPDLLAVRLRKAMHWHAPGDVALSEALVAEALSRGVKEAA